jgi:hypothetical protein
MKSLVLTNKQLSTIKKNLIDGMNLASAARGSATYYHSKDEQNLAIRNAIKGLYDQSKELPLILANQKGSTGKFIQEVLLNEFKNTTWGGSCNIVNGIDWHDNGLSDKAIFGALYNLNENGIPYVLRMFVSMKERGINNERARKITLSYIWNHPNIEFNAIKYRNKIGEILKHIYGVKRFSILVSIAENILVTGAFKNEKEYNIAYKNILRYSPVDSDVLFKLFLFIAKRGKSEWYSKTQFPFINQYYVAEKDVLVVKNIPEEVLIGLVSSKNHPQYDQLWSTKIKRETTKAQFRKNVEVTSVDQQIRQTKSTEKLGVVKNVNMEKAKDYLALYKTGYENGFTAEIYNAIEVLAEKKKMKNFPYRNVGVVLDKSISMTGNKIDSKNTPRAIAEFTVKILTKSSENCIVESTENESTDLASAFIRLLKKENNSMSYDAIFFVTDGYENEYEGLTNEVVNTYMVESNRCFPIFQVSPILGAETDANVRGLGSEIVKLAVNDPVSVLPQINARLLEIDTKKWLENQFLLLEEMTVSRYYNNNIVTFI